MLIAEGIMSCFLISDTSFVNFITISRLSKSADDFYHALREAKRKTDDYTMENVFYI